MHPRWTLAVLVTVAFLNAPIEAGDSWRLETLVVPTAQLVELTLDPAREDYEGRVRIELEVREAVDSFRFHAEGPSLESWQLTGSQGEVEAILRQDEAGFVTASMPTPLKPGAYVLVIDFKQKFNTKGEAIYRTVAGGVPYLFSQLQAVHARKAFPCWDEPGFKIPYQMRLRVPAGLVAVANTAVESESTTEGWREITFAATKPLPSYLLAVAVGALEAVPVDGLPVPGTLYTVKGQSHLAASAVAVTPPILQAMAEYFERPYPYAKLDLLAVPEFLYGAMENAGAVTFRDELLLLDPEAASAAEQGNLVAIMAHELAHMWFGDLVTMAWWDDLWLNESFASFAGDKISQQLSPEYQFDLSQKRSANWVMSVDALPSTEAIRHDVEGAADIFKDLGLAYVKGQALLEMIENWMGPERFRRGVVGFLKEHAWKNATASDLWRALAEETDVDVEAVLSGYLDQPGVPLLEGELTSDGRLVLHQSRLLNLGLEGPEVTWTIPVALRLAANGETSARSVLLRAASDDLELGRDVSWLTLDSGGFGYYRWRLVGEQMLWLADRAVEVLSTPERIAFLGNVEALLNAGSVTGAEYLGLLKSFGEDPEAGVVQAMLDGLSTVKMAFNTEGLEPLLAEYVRQALSPAVERFGLTARASEEPSITLLRTQLFGWLGDTGEDAEVQAEALRLAEVYMADPGRVDPSLGAISLRIAAIHGDRALFDAYLAEYEAATVPQEKENYLAALGSFRDPLLQRAALDLSLTDKVPSSDVHSVLWRMVQTEAGSESVMRWIESRYPDISSRFAEENVAVLPYAAQGCSEKVLQRATEFFSQPEHQVEGTLDSLERTTDSTTDCLNLRRREGAAVEEYLSQFAVD